MHQLFTQVNFLFWQPGRVGGQYTTDILLLKMLMGFRKIGVISGFRDQKLVKNKCQIHINKNDVAQYSIKWNINHMQQNSKCGDWDETVNHIISEASQLAQKECKKKLRWVGKGNPWELCKKQKFHLTNKCYIYKLESGLENKTHKILWDIEIPMDHPIPTRRRPDLVLIDKPLAWKEIKINK